MKKHSLWSTLLLFSIPPFMQGQKMLKIGHRGACGYAVENTINSFEKAIELGVDMIELDIQQCASGELIVFHDRFIQDVGYIKDLTLNKLKNINLNDTFKKKSNKYESIPTLQEVLDAINKRVTVNIEIKGDINHQQLVNILSHYTKTKGWHYDHFLISSFNHHALKAIKKMIPSIKIGVLIAALPIDYAACAQALKAYSIHIPYDFTTKEFIQDARARKIKFFSFTVNKSNKIAKLKEKGVDGIFSDYPDRL